MTGRTPEPLAPLPRSGLYQRVNEITGGNLELILAYEVSQETSPRKIAKVLFEQYDVSVSHMTIRLWIKRLELRYPTVSALHHKRGNRLPPLPTEVTGDPQ